jgi:hypothetical protein
METVEGVFCPKCGNQGPPCACPDSSAHSRCGYWGEGLGNCILADAHAGPHRFEPFAPSVRLRGGRVVTPTGRQWLMAFAMAGCQWAINALAQQAAPRGGEEA